jgi:hypothetical protein
MTTEKPESKQDQEKSDQSLDKDLAWGHEYLKALPDDKKSQT